MQILLSEGRITREGLEANSLATERYEVFWHGLVYCDGCPSGAASMRRFAEEAASGLAQAAARLKGVYFVALRDKQSQQCYAFVDNSALYHAYYSPRFAGTSFLRIAAAENLGTEQIDPEALAELLHFGCIYSGKTLFPSIRLIDAETIVATDPTSNVKLLPKPLPDVGIPADCTWEGMLKSLADAIANQSVSVDLTGGVDSRLLAVLLSYFGLQFELAGSGRVGNQDLRIAQSLAKTLGREFYPTYHDPERTDWEAIFELCDGLFDLAKADRPLQLQRDRLRRGKTLAISGAGGELFKDFFWLQDFPFYVRSNPRLERLYATRIAPSELKHSLLAGKYRASSATSRDRLLNTLSSYAVPGNTQTYDRIYYGFKMQAFAGRFLTNSVKFIQVHTPYLDRDAVRIAYGMRRRDRVFNRFQRRLITGVSPEIARVPTTEGGMTVSSHALHLSLDLLKYVKDRSVRLLQKAGQRFFARTYWQESADHPKLEHILRHTLASRRSIDRLKDCGILNPAIQLGGVDSRYLGSLLAVDMLIARLDSGERVKDEAEGRSRIAA